MTDTLYFTPEERQQISALYAELKQKIAPTLTDGDEERLRKHLLTAVEEGQVQRDLFGLNPIVSSLQTAMIAVDEIGLRREAVLAIMLRPCVDAGFLTVDEVSASYGSPVGRILHGLQRIQELYKKNPVIESENFRNLLLSFAEDMRVILIMIADRVNLMRLIRDAQNEEAKHRVSEEAAYLYAPLAHKLGLYKLKSELEDLSLKYLEHDAYYHIKEKLNATKAARDAYVERFIGPIEQKLKDAGLKFHMKGRTKSIHSIWQKMKKQKCAFEGVYDLFAIRIIIDCPPEKEKQQCWQTFAIITDMYTSNPKRMRDWLSVPKSNGYESLHITVLGPEQKWVEVQIRTERMDEIAERGVAAHWRYKGVKSSEGGMDEWLNGIRQMLEDTVKVESSEFNTMDMFRMDLYDDEIYVFTPKGDLLKFPKGATVLDMAYHIHSKVGSACTGARINNKVVTFRQELHSGDQVEILTSSTQRPKQEWLNIVKTSRARAKIRLAIKETQQKDALLVKEMLERKFRNRHIEQDEGLMMRVIRKLGYKEASDFYRDMASDVLDVQTVIDKYVELQQSDRVVTGDNVARSADEFVLDNSQFSALNSQVSDDVLVIGQDLKGLDFHLAHCCNPIYGDPVFGFVTTGGGIKIHRMDCPNAAEMRRRFGYRIVKARWSGKGSSQYQITLRVIGNDDLGIVNNLTSIISKDEKLVLRSINIDSNDGIFRGTLTIMINDNTRLEGLIKKLRTVKGVKQVERI
ncbi:MAG: bifunctional (p)ppGpp synthetase/guanosine-3',5'-bis(diphosphate) 3'-pyrophosphohydrolase [Prevotella sp.]|nr:bifunctional (p)ppGpp synthetase/guanosine-3',5'-bis(diphosphate) 3'-pyrophosphohydrolase [Prevotella sp.]